MADKSLTDIVTEWLADLMRGGANQTNITPISQVAEQNGYPAEALADVPWGQAYNAACTYPGVPSGYPPVNPGASHAEVVRNVTNLTEVSNTNTQIFNITDNSETIDNSIDLSGADIDASGEGGFNLEQQNNSATGQSAASDEGDANNASEGGLVNTGTNLGNQNSGDRSNVLGGTTVDLDFGGGQSKGVDFTATPQPGDPGTGIVPPGFDPRLSLPNDSGRVIDTGGGEGGGGLPGFPDGGPPVLNLNTGDAGGDIEQTGQELDLNVTTGPFSPIEDGPGDQTNNEPDAEAFAN